MGYAENAGKAGRGDVNERFTDDYVILDFP
jgi:hypothetical protein